jgi:hypothetical protein
LSEENLSPPRPEETGEQDEGTRALCVTLGKRIPRRGIGLSNRPFYPVFESPLADSGDAIVDPEDRFV